MLVQFETMESPDIGIFLQSALMLQGISQVTLSDLVGVEQRYLSLMLRGHKKMPAEVFEKICSILRLSPAKMRKYYIYSFNAYGDLEPKQSRAIINQ